MKAISPIILATRMHAAVNGEGNAWIVQAPRRREMLWFLQWSSMQPGGLPALARRLVEKFPDRFQTKVMQSLKPDSRGLYSVGQCLEIWRDRTLKFWLGVQLDTYERLMEEAGEEEDRRNKLLQEPGDMSFRALARFITNKTTAADALGNDAGAGALKTAAQKFNRPWLLSALATAAMERLPDRLREICETDEETCASSRCLDLEKALLDYMDAHAREVGTQIAETVITRTVRRELEFALSSGVPVPIVGESRYGKTKSVANWCQMHPGRARMVTVPEGNTELDFMRAHADALGIEYSSHTSRAMLKDKVEFVIKRAGLGIIYDEAHYAVPINYNAATPPRRLNWIRAKLIDRDVPTAFFATPQSYKQTLAKYAEETGYRIEQWLGRVSPAVILSDVIPFEEIVAVARAKFPELNQAQLEELADRAIVSDGHLKSLEHAGKRARFLATERGHDKPTTQDVLDG